MRRVLSPFDILVRVLAVLALSACQRPEEKSGEVQISLVLDAARTLKTVEGTVDEDGVAYWYVLIYDAQGNLLKEMMDLTQTRYDMIVDASQYACVTLYAFANIDPDSLQAGWSDEQSLLSNSYGLEIVQQSGLLPMCCRLQTAFTSSGTVKISLERMVSKICLNSLAVDLKGEFENDDFVQGPVYLQNVVPQMSLEQYFAGTSDIAAEQGHYPWFYHDNWMYSKFNSGKYQGEHNESDALGLLGGGTVFYTLPNFSRSMPSEDPDWADLCTKLVVEADYLYKYVWIDLDVYYPVEVLNRLSGCLEPNNIYNVDITVHCPGYLDPWGPRVSSDPQVSFSLEVYPWNKCSIKETI